MGSFRGCKESAPMGCGASRNGVSGLDERCFLQVAGEVRAPRERYGVRGTDQDVSTKQPVIGDVNRKDLQLLARVRLAGAKTLLDAGRPDGAYYLAGYAVECALKACIARGTLRHEFPGKKTVDASHTHNLRDLIKVANLARSSTSNRRDHETRSFNGFLGVLATLRETLLPVH